jgi:hypothetical protein
VPGFIPHFTFSTHLEKNHVFLWRPHVSVSISTCGHIEPSSLVNISSKVYRLHRDCQAVGQVKMEMSDVSLPRGRCFSNRIILWIVTSCFCEVNRLRCPCLERRESTRMFLSPALRHDHRRFSRLQPQFLRQQKMQELICHTYRALPTRYEDQKGKYLIDESCPCSKPKVLSGCYLL